MKIKLSDLKRVIKEEINNFYGFKTSNSSFKRVMFEEIMKQDDEETPEHCDECGMIHEPDEECPTAQPKQYQKYAPTEDQPEEKEE